MFLHFQKIIKTLKLGLLVYVFLFVFMFDLHFTPVCLDVFCVYILFVFDCICNSIIFTPHIKLWLHLTCVHVAWAIITSDFLLPSKIKGFLWCCCAVVCGLGVFCGCSLCLSRSTHSQANQYISPNIFYRN